MTTYGVTSDGFVLKRLDDILTEAESSLSTIQDPVSGENLQPDFDSSDPTMQVIKVPLEDTSDAWELGQATYNVTNPANAVGPALDNVNDLRGITRKPAIASYVADGLATGTPGLTINASVSNPMLVSDQLNEQTWAITADFTFDGVTGEAIVTATATTTGPISAVADSITKIVTPQSGWASFNNPTEAILGQDQESDTAFRRRGDLSTLAPAAGPGEAVYSNILNIEDVLFCRVYINRSLVVDSNGLPPKSQATIVQGGDDNTIIQTIFARSGAGVAFVGNVVGYVIDAQGLTYPVSFYRPIEVIIYVQVNVTIVDSGIFPSDGADEIAQAIVTYSQQGSAGLGIDAGFNDQFQPGEDIVRSRLYTPINSVPGGSIDSVLLSTDNVTFLPADIPILYNELGVFSIANTTVNIT